MQSATQTLTTKKVGPNKLVLGFLVAAMTALVGTAGIAHAAPVDKPTKEQCKAAGHDNYGQCVREWAKERGNGYGGGNINIDLDVNGNNNAISIIINYMIGA
ncbi:MAG: hypothetical protein ACREGJ_03850 [Candidatus Saccharimonadales bacterium]